MDHKDIEKELTDEDRAYLYNLYTAGSMMVIDRGQLERLYSLGLVYTVWKVDLYGGYGERVAITHAGKEQVREYQSKYNLIWAEGQIKAEEKAGKRNHRVDTKREQ